MPWKTRDLPRQPSTPDGYEDFPKVQDRIDATRRPGSVAATVTVALVVLIAALLLLGIWD
ncbi:MAG TPA: hypothetical protein VEH84_06140 [Alphaproteobacteria bacterium]|nr:hypothetical protein [Alphaproteobacteria bacterium]